MSLYWQQAVQNRGSAPQASQNHAVSAGNTQNGQWQNVSLGDTQHNYWSQEPVNKVQQSYQQNQVQNRPPANVSNQNHQQHAPYQPAYTAPAVQHMPILRPTETQNAPQNIEYPSHQMYAVPSGEIQCQQPVQTGAHQLIYDYSQYSGFAVVHSHEQHYLPQVSSLSSIPEFETVDFPATTTTISSVLPAPHQSEPVQEHPVVSLPTEQVEEKPSSQVTPESTYSVDTFNSSQSKEEKKEDDWDDWEQTPRESVHERSPFAAESTQSEPAPSIQSDHSRESTVGWDHQADHTMHEPERTSDVQPIAQVAPLVKNPPEFEQPVARVGPVIPTSTETNVRRVAPTRPIQAAEPIAESTEVRSTENIDAANQASSSHGIPLATPNPLEVPSVAATASISQEMPNIQLQQDEDFHHLAAPELEERRITPDSDQLQVENIGQAQATSTPNDTVEERERIPERRSSVSSIRSGMQPLSGHTQNGEHSDSTQGSVAFSRGGVRASYQERYKGVKEKYLDTRSLASQVMRRLDQTRTDTPKLVRGNPLTDISGRRSAIQITSRKVDPTNASFAADRGNLSNYSQPDPALNESIDISTNGAGYGEDFVDASRRSRLNRSRPPSRAKSDIGDEMPYHRGHMPHHHQGRHFDNRGYPVHPQYYGYPPMGRHSGRMSATGMSYQNDYYQQQVAMYQRPRPQSTYDARAMERFQRSGGNMMSYDAFGPRSEEEEDESFSDESDLADEAGESEDEMRTYNMSRGVNNSFSSYTMASQQHQPVGLRYGSKEIYYFGVIRLDTENVDAVFRKFKVPRVFDELKPIEKAAYLYYTVLNNKLITFNQSVSEGVNRFQLTFNKEYYKYKCEGDNSSNALIKICKSMYDEYMQKRQNSQQKAYEASQKQLFSDDRESADGMSDRASVYDRDDDRASDILSIDQRAPPKWRTPHAFLKFGPGGKKIVVKTDQSVSVVAIDDVRTSLQDNHSRRIIDAAQNFKGPLITERTPPHSVLLYIQNQIMRIQHSEVAKENPNSCDVVDCLLLWRLLETVVKQHGRVTGPDIANLLVSVGYSTSKKGLSNHREKSATPSAENVKPAPADPKAYEIFTHYLLGGHVDEAVKCAVNNGLHADAMILVRRIFSGDERKLADIEARFLSTRPSSNPVMTLVAVASGQPAPVLTNPPIDDAGSWRSHAAIVLANLNTSHAKETVYRLGCVLAKRDYHAAADFCFLAVALLSNFEGVNVFQKPAVTDDDSDARQFVSLIHASLPDDEWDSTMCRFGFSLTDLHATEIFDYAIKMAAPPGFVSPLQNSADFQRKRLQYAQLLAHLGGFQAEAFRYLLSVACSIWGYYQWFSVLELTTLADLADSLQLFAAEDAADITWIDSLRGMIEFMKTNQSGSTSQHLQSAQEVQAQPEQELQQTTESLTQETVPPADLSQVTNFHHQQQQHPQEVLQQEINPIQARSRTDSITVEARDWHADRQEPIQMSPRGSTATPNSFRRDSVAPTAITSPYENYTTPRSRAESISTPREPTYGEELCQKQQQYYMQHGQNDYDSTTESAETTSHESSPIRQRPQVTSNAIPDWQPAYEPPGPSPPQILPQALQPTSAPVKNPSQPQQPSPAHNPATHPQPNGMKKANNSSWVGSIMDKVRKAIPDGKAVHLPDDKEPKIRWDSTLNKWVDDDAKEEAAPPPPPPAAMSAPASAPSTTLGSSGGLAAVRGARGSRYVNVAGSSGSTTLSAPVGMLVPPAPMSFNFIPSQPDDADSVDPFSGESNPTIHGVDQTGQQPK